MIRIILEAFLFVASGGIFCALRFRERSVLTVLIGVFALISSWLLGETLIERSLSANPYYQWFIYCVVGLMIIAWAAAELISERKPSGDSGKASQPEPMARTVSAQPIEPRPHLSQRKTLPTNGYLTWIFDGLLQVATAVVILAIAVLFTRIESITRLEQLRDIFLANWQDVLWLRIYVNQVSLLIVGLIIGLMDRQLFKLIEQGLTPEILRKMFRVVVSGMSRSMLK